MKTKLSVIIPTYNEEKEILKCIESLREQSYKNFEIIVVDDGSTDKTLEIAKKFSEVRILSQNHNGPGEARNLGAKNAKGEILVFIDADMTFDKNYIKNLIEPILKNKAVGATHDYEIATNTDNKYSFLWGKERVAKDNAKDVNVFRAIRKADFMRLGGFDYKYGYADDQTFWFKYKIKPVVAENTICYHRNPTTLKSTYKHAKWIGTSWKEKYKLFKIPIIGHLGVLAFFALLPFSIFLKSTLVSLKTGFSYSDTIKYYISKFYGYSEGVFKAVYYGQMSK